jgi:DNA-binding transcriptional ArsR family regulator
MKTITFLSLFLTTSVFGQHIKNEERKLNEAFAKTNYWASYNGSDDKVSALDSAMKYDAIFSKKLSKCLKTDPSTISYNFKTLVEKGMKIVTSEDGNFRIYSWDDETGGTMRRFNKIFQFRDKKKALSKESTNENDECFYSQINDVISENKTFYVTQSISILSSAMSYHNIKIFSIDNGKLNDKAVLIKTKSGIKNQLGYETDLSSQANRDQEDDIPDYSIVYDKKNKIIAIPLILSNGKITSEKIKYQFKGKYFEKL